MTENRAAQHGEDIPASQRREFICLMAVLMSLVALSIDAMLPALGHIGQSLQVADPNDTQWVISSIFLGMALGLMLYGPLSDSYGRKNAIYLGLGVFLIGDLVALFSTDLYTMLFGRVLQGFGGAACRVVTLAMIRDKFEGQRMARVMSLIMMFFVLIPALAPSIGQAILMVGNWHSIFLLIFSVGFVGLLWLHFRQPETLEKEKRRAFSPAVIGSGMKETITHPVTRVYILTAGVMFGAFVGYLSSAQQVLQQQYELGESFALYFGGLALVIGFSSFMNAKLVMKYKMESLCMTALMTLTLTALGFFIFAYQYSGHPPLMTFVGFVAVTFFCFGVLLGNFNTLALQPLGHIAGVANSVISASQTLVSVIIGGSIGQYYDGTVLPLVAGFSICGLVSVGLMIWVLRATKTQAATSAAAAE